VSTTFVGLEHRVKRQRLFVVQKLVLTMKGLKETLKLPWRQQIETLHFFMPFMVRSAQSYSSSSGGLKCQPILALDSLVGVVWI